MCREGYVLGPVFLPKRSPGTVVTKARERGQYEPGLPMVGFLPGRVGAAPLCASWHLATSEGDGSADQARYPPVEVCEAVSPHFP